MGAARPLLSRACAEPNAISKGRLQRSHAAFTPRRFPYRFHFGHTACLIRSLLIAFLRLCLMDSGELPSCNSGDHVEVSITMLEAYLAVATRGIHG